MPKKMLALYSLAHFWVDLSCAFLIFRTMLDSPELPICLLLYNFCAFALQMPLGLLADRFDRNSVVASVGCLLVAVAFFIPSPLPASVIAGTGNALFHLGGGVDTLNNSERKSAALGIFVSPGAMGLYFGTLWGKGTALALLVPPLFLAFFSALILLVFRTSFGSFRSGNLPVDLSGNVVQIIPLFLVVVLRSYMGMNQSFDWKSTGHWVLILTVSLAVGKAGGGILTDFSSPRTASALSLGLAAGLYLFSSLPLPGTFAVFFFNMTMPVTLWAVARIMPGAKGFTFGLLTFGLFLGFLPSWFGWAPLFTQSWHYTAAALLSLALLFPALKKEWTVCS